jgi:hypothetical protein
MSLAEIAGPPIMMFIFYKSTAYAKNDPIFYGTPFFLGAFVALIGFFIMRWGFRRLQRIADARSLDEQPQEEATSQDLLAD